MCWRISADSELCSATNGNGLYLAQNMAIAADLTRDFRINQI